MYADAPDTGGIREDLGGYMGILGKYGQDISGGKANWEKLKESGDWMENAEAYIKEAHGKDAKTVYNALKMTGDAMTLMSFGMKQKYGEEGVNEMLGELAAETRERYTGMKKIAEDAGMPKFGGYFDSIGDSLAGLYSNSMAGYLQAEGMMHLTEASEGIANGLKDFGGKIEKQLEQLTATIEKLSDRYGDI